jgi:hypothetical protein
MAAGTAALTARWTSSIAPLTAAAFREASRSCVVVLKSAARLAGLTNREFGRGPRGRLTLDARQLRTDQGPVEPNGFGRRLGLSIPIVTVHRLVLRPVSGRGLWLFGLWLRDQNCVRVSILLHRLEHLVVRGFN